MLDANFPVNHLPDSSGCLQSVLQTWITLDEAKVSQYLDQPLGALEEILVRSSGQIPPRLAIMQG